jgi:hypothetical protein
LSYPSLLNLYTVKIVKKHASMFYFKNQLGRREN